MKSLTLLLCTTLVICSCSSMVVGTRYETKVEDQKIDYLYDEKEGPTIIFESGLGDGLESWNDIYAEMSKQHSVFSYSRPGYSKKLLQSVSGKPRTADDVAKLLKQTLKKASVKPPYILVGHSMGGLYMLEFARDYPELVAGLLLVETRLPKFASRCQQAGVSPCSPPAFAAVISPPHIRAELKGIKLSETNGPTAEEINPIPTILLAATEPPKGAPEQGQKIWLEVQEEFSDNLTNGYLKIIQGAGHYLHQDNPDEVITAIQQLLNSK